MAETLQAKARIPLLAVAGFTALAAVLVYMSGKHTLHAPDLGLLMRQPPVLKLHVIAAVSAFLLGVVMFFTRKGAGFHRAAGWMWVLLMAAVAGSSLFITGLNGNAYSFIHLLSGWTLILLPIGLWAARTHRVVRHRRTMTGLFLGGMVVAGGFTFFPGRLMWALFFG